MMSGRSMVSRTSGSLPRNTESWRGKWQMNNNDDNNNNIINNNINNNNMYISDVTQQMLNDSSALSHLSSMKDLYPSNNNPSQALTGMKMGRGRVFLEMNHLNHHLPGDSSGMECPQSTSTIHSNYQHSGSFGWEGRFSEDAKKNFANSFTRKKTRSASFYEEDEEEGKGLEALMADPAVAFQVLLNQNKRQKLKLNKIQENIFSAKTAELQNKMSMVPLKMKTFDHLGCKLELLSNKIESRQLVVESLRHQFQQKHLHNSYFDQKAFKKLFKEQLLIDKDLSYEEKAHEISGQDFELPVDAALKGSHGTDEGPEREMEKLENSLQDASLHKLASKTASREILEEHQEHLLKMLTELDAWLTKSTEECTKLRALGGDLATLKNQRSELQPIQAGVEERRVVMEKVAEACYLLLHKQHNAGATSRRFEELVQSVPIKWADLRHHVVDCQMSIATVSKSLQQLEKHLQGSEEAIRELNGSIFWLPAHKLGFDNLKSELKRAKAYQKTLNCTKASVDTSNDKANELQDSGFVLSHKYVSRLEEANRVLKEVDGCLEERIKELTNFLKAKHHSLQIFIAIPVQPPWERALTNRNAPYYINHESESTHWDHPDMMSLMRDLNSLNVVRFSAYRTAMKLRMLQIRLRLSSLSLDKVSEYLNSPSSLKNFNHPTNASAGQYTSQRSNEKEQLSSDQACIQASSSCLTDHSIGTGDIVTWLLDMFSCDYVRTVSTYDLILNWLFNVYDGDRSGTFKSLSVKAALTLLSNGDLRDKFIQIFQLFANEEGFLDPPSLSLLFLALLLIPHQLGESVAFGGLDVESSVRSCFELSACTSKVSMEQFLEWTDKEPQSLVWIHVLHRLISAERSIHQSRCFVCKVFPITGFRYHCLMCFAADMCQNCFFSGCTTKQHKLNHPMQEYICEATSGEEIRDLKTLLRNRLRSKQNFKKHNRAEDLAGEHFHNKQAGNEVVAEERRVEEHVLREADKTSYPKNNHKTTEKYALKNNENNNNHITTNNLNNTDANNNTNNNMNNTKINHNSNNHNNIIVKTSVEDDDSSLKLVQSEPSLFYRELSVDTGNEHFNGNELSSHALLFHKNALEARIQYLEGHNKEIEQKLESFNHYNFDKDTRVLSFNDSPQLPRYTRDIGGGVYPPSAITNLPPPFNHQNLI